MRFSIFIFCVITFSLSSCYERVSDCLDELSTNFEISADDLCEDCCTYPPVKFQITHFLGDVAYTKDSVITTNFGTKISLDKAIILLSNFNFKSKLNEELLLLNSGLYEDAEGQEFSIKEDHLVILQSSRLLTLGNMREIGEIDSINCSFGINHQLVPLETTSKLYNYDSLYVENQYYDMVLYLKTGDSLDIDKTVKFRHMTQNNFLRDSVLTFVKTPRNDVGFELEINYLDILKGLDISSSERIIIVPEYVIPTNVFNFKL